MDSKEAVEMKTLLTVQLIKSILIENGIITRDEFRSRLLEKIDKTNFSEEEKNALRENV